jgi:hypothetical protein
VSTSCDGCGAKLSIEFDPPNRPGVGAIIERVDEPVSTHSGDGHAHGVKVRRP